MKRSGAELPLCTWSGCGGVPSAEELNRRRGASLLQDILNVVRITVVYIMNTQPQTSAGHLVQRRPVTRSHAVLFY